MFSGNHIQYKHQNSLTREKVANLVFIFNNLQIKNKVCNLKFKDQFLQWLNEDENLN